MDDTLDTHCILCGENYVSGCFRALPNINGSDWTDELHDVVPAAIKTSWTNAIKFVMQSSDAEFKANLSNYFDVNSLIDYLLYGIVSTNLDGYGKNQIYFTYDGVHWIASVYDLDSTWGLYWNGGSFVSTTYSRKEFQDHKDGQGNQLYDRLEKLFIPQLKARYTELRKDVLSASHIIQKFEEFNDVCPKDIVQEDYASTTGEGKFTGIPSKTTNNIQQLRSYINARLTYVDNYINALQEAVPCTNITLNKTELTITEAGSSTPTEETINTTWSSGALCRTTAALSTKDVAFGDCFSSIVDITTDFINCASSNTFTVTTPTPVSGNGGIGVVGYNNSKNAIAVYEYKNNQYSWTNGISEDGIACTISGTNIPIQNIPDNVAYIRICINQSTSNNTTITKTTTTSQEKLIATVTPTNTTDKVVWSVNPTGICTVNNGTVTPIKNGTCVITATCGNQSATCNVTVNLPTVACTNINLNKTALQLGTIQGAQPDTETNLLEGLTWKDGQLNNSTGEITTGTDKYIVDIKISATGLYTLSANVDYRYLKLFLFNNNGQLLRSSMEDNNNNPVSMYVYEPNCYISVSVFPNSLDFTANNVSLKYIHNLANTPNKDVDIQATVIGRLNLLATSGDYRIVELYADRTYDEVAAIKLGSTIYKLYNYIPQNIHSDGATTSIERANNGYCTKGQWDGKTFFNIPVPSTWGDTKEDIANYIQTNNIAVVINPSEYLDSADKVSTTTINKYQLVPTVEPSNTTDVVEWSVSPEGIVTAENGLVKAVSNGETVVTATCGTQSATCNVTVSNLPDISSINYELSEPLVCDGTSTYKDTGIQLMSSNNIDKDWTMLLEFTPAQLRTDRYDVIVHCMNENYDLHYPGINIDIGMNTRRVVIPNNKQLYTGPQPVIGTAIQYALVKQEKVFTLYDKTGAVLASGPIDGDITPVEQTLLLGAYQTTNGTKGRFFNGTINKFKLVEEIYTVPQIKQYFSTVDESIAYTLPQETTFNGTSDYVDTGVQLFKTDHDFTITMDVTVDTQVNAESVLMHCMKEQSPYPGIVIQKDGSSIFALSAGNNTYKIPSLIKCNQRTKVVIVKNETTMKAYTSDGVTGESPYVFNSIDQTLILGAYQTVDGVKGRFFNGTIHEFSISNTVYTNEQINTYLGITSQGPVFKIDSTCMNTTGNKLTDSIGGIEATLGGAPTVSNNQIVFTENDTFNFDLTSLNLTSKNRTLRVKFTPTILPNNNSCTCVIGENATDWGKLTTVYSSKSGIRIQHGSGTIDGNTVGSNRGGSSNNRLPNGQLPSIDTEYEIIISEEANTNKIRWFVNGTLVQDGTTTLHNPLFLANTEGNNRFIGSYSLIEIYDEFCDTYEDFTNIKDN